MDPNETLHELRDYASRLLDEVDRANKTGVADFSSSEEAYTMAEKFEALDGWLARGGFLPGSWRSKSRTCADYVGYAQAEIDQRKREQELERARKHTYRPYDTSGQERA